ncbi:urease accessory protein UreF [Granulicoccus phenolivorans]|uniref:urease accessory protein UreF n=1 Tax=Granulicoccus phenolivorans TaxID=266854 RepID=UPI0004049C9C|nr:urease accessory UreF family protein [Granulicoccus phenolivorans]
MPSTPTEPPVPLALIQLIDSAAPTGAFSHSFGLETAISDQRVRDADSCGCWLRRLVHGSLARTDALAIRCLMRREVPLTELDTLLRVSTAPIQVRRAQTTIGRRMLTLADTCFPTPGTAAYAAEVAAGRATGQAALVLATLGTDLGLSWPTVARLSLHSTLSSLVGNAVRAVPLGQNAGQRVLAGLHPDIEQAVQTAATAGIDELGATDPALEIDQMRHAYQLTRMFMS